MKKFKFKWALFITLMLIFIGFAAAAVGGACIVYNISNGSKYGYSVILCVIGIITMIAGYVLGDSNDL